MGEATLITPPEIAREMAEMIEWASLIVVRGAGHLSALEEPERVTERHAPVAGQRPEPMGLHFNANNVAKGDSCITLRCGTSVSGLLENRI